MHDSSPLTLEPGVPPQQAPRKTRPPGPSTYRQLTHLQAAWRTTPTYLFDQAERYGGIVYLTWPGRCAYFLNHPAFIKQVLQERSTHFGKAVTRQGWGYQLLGNGLINNTGEFHRVQRRLMQPAFHRQRLDQMATAMTTATTDLLEQRWEGYALREEPFDAAAEMARLTLRILCLTLFSHDVGPEAEQVRLGFGLVNAAMLHATRMPLMMLPGIPNQAKQRFQVGVALLDAAVAQLIQIRRNQAGSGDLLSLLLAARDAEASNGMDDRQLRDEVMTLLLAGHETTAVALSWIWYLLTQHPEVERALHMELDRVLAGRVPTITDVANLPYLRMVIQEAMRLYPPVWGFERRALVDEEIGGYPIPKGAGVLLSPYVTHRLAEVWKEPAVFRPERFAEGLEGIQPFAYFPFGGGPRLCIGSQFAMMEMSLVLATIAQHYRLQLVGTHPIEAEPQMTLRLRHGLQVTLQSR